MVGRGFVVLCLLLAAQCAFAQQKEYDRFPTVDELLGESKPAGEKTPPAVPLDSSPRPVPAKRSPVFMMYEYPMVKNAKRQVEFSKTLQINIDHPSVEQLHLFVTPAAKAYLTGPGKPADPKNKLVLIDTTKQPLYNEYFKYANEKLPGKICIVLNADIWMQDGFEHLLPSHFANGKTAFALSRYQMPGCGYKQTVCRGDGTDSVPEHILAKARAEEAARHDAQTFDSDDIIALLEEEDETAFLESLSSNRAVTSAKHKMTSHDAFLFLSPLPQGVLEKTAHRQNMWSAESRVIWAMKTSGMTVENPCLTLKTYHEHCTEDRSTWMVNPLKERDGSKFRDYGAEGSAVPTTLALLK